ncbi:hypothetical protein AOQ73_27850 [Bradyrhizobium pachyrhizi]|nr:hypothetical protein AOQ73_27850 [Bradyrhizobium pachyrhizi]
MTMSDKILVTGTSVREELLKPLVEAGFVIDNPTHLLSEDELAAALADKAGYLLGGDEFATAKALQAAKKLKIIAFLGMGYQSYVDADAAEKGGIAVTNTPGTLNNAVAEFTIGLLLNSTRRIHQYALAYSEGKSGKEEKQRDLANLHVGIVGLGGIGTRIAEILRWGVNCSVSYFSRTRKPAEEARLGLTYRPLDELSESVDVLIVMTPGNAETRGLIGRRQFDKFKPGLILINSARAEIVDPTALLDALSSGKLGYAGFDGFYEQSEIANAAKPHIPTRLVITGHIASLTNDARDAMANRAVASIINMIKFGKDPYRVR